MNKSTYVVVGLLVLFILAISTYTYKSENKVIEDVKNAVKDTFLDKAQIETNHKIDSFSFYLPKNLNVQEEEESNIILNDGEQLYIVFYNNFEDEFSELNYQAAKNDQALLLEPFKDKDKFGYIRILPDEEKDYQLQVGVGGVKITTYTKRAKLESEAVELMKIARSIVETSANK